MVVLVNNFKLISSTDISNKYKINLDGRFYDLSIAKNGDLLDITPSDRASCETATINNSRIEFGVKG